MIYEPADDDRSLMIRVAIDIMEADDYSYSYTDRIGLATLLTQAMIEHTRRLYSTSPYTLARLF